MVCAGSRSQIDITNGDWAFVDIGFSNDKRSCGFLLNDGEACEMLFSELCKELNELSKIKERTLNIVIEAPLSVAFTKDGDPTGRSFEKGRSGHRYWYVPVGCLVMVSAGYLLRGFLDASPSREVRIFEAFVSFKTGGKPSSHTADVSEIKRAVENSATCTGIVVDPDDIATDKTHVVRSAFAAWGFDLGIPPVIKA